MKTSHRRWLIAGICALLLMSSFTVYLILRDRQKIDASFVAYRLQLDSLFDIRGQERFLMHDSTSRTSVFPDTALRNLRIREAEIKLRSEHTLANTRLFIHASDSKKILWASLMGVAGIIGLVIIFTGNKTHSA